MDRLLESVARSFGERAIGVILTGMWAIIRDLTDRKRADPASKAG